jgi:hypothetical protein
MRTETEKSGQEKAVENKSTDEIHRPTQEELRRKDCTPTMERIAMFR